MRRMHKRKLKIYWKQKLISNFKRIKNYGIKNLLMPFHAAAKRAHILNIKSEATTRPLTDVVRMVNISRLQTFIYIMKIWQKVYAKSD